MMTPQLPFARFAGNFVTMEAADGGEGPVAVVPKQPPQELRRRAGAVAAA
jgi:hypothetical protein